MIARVWHGFTKPEHADVYESHLKPELLPGLSQKQGFRGSYLLRRLLSLVIGPNDASISQARYRSENAFSAASHAPRIKAWRR